MPLEVATRIPVFSLSRSTVLLTDFSGYVHLLVEESANAGFGYDENQSRLPVVEVAALPPKGYTA